MTNSDAKPSLVLLHTGKYKPGMTAEEAVNAGGLVLCGEVNEATRAEMLKLAQEQGVSLELIPIDANNFHMPNPVLFGQGFTSTETDGKHLASIELMLEARVVPDARKRLNNPPWMGKKPWWQR